MDYRERAEKIWRSLADHGRFQNDICKIEQALTEAHAAGLAGGKAKLEVSECMRRQAKADFTRVEAKLSALSAKMEEARAALSQCAEDDCICDRASGGDEDNICPHCIAKKALAPLPESEKPAPDDAVWTMRGQTL